MNFNIRPLIYVDPLHSYAKSIGYNGQYAEQAARVGERHNHQWCHLFADEADCLELHHMAKRIGLRREWFHGDHYDLVPTKRIKAIALGAIELTQSESVAIWKKHREISHEKICDNRST